MHFLFQYGSKIILSTRAEQNRTHCAYAHTCQYFLYPYRKMSHSLSRATYHVGSPGQGSALNKAEKSTRIFILCSNGELHYMLVVLYGTYIAKHSYTVRR